MDKSSKSSKTSYSRSSSSIDDSLFSTDSTQTSGAKDSGKSGKPTLRTSTREESRKARQALHQAERQNRLAEARDRVQNALVADIVQQSMKLESQMTKDFGIGSADTDKLGTALQMGLKHARDCIAHGLKEFQLLLNRCKTTSSVSESTDASLDSDTVQRNKITVDLVTIHYQFAIDTLNKVQETLNNNRRELEYNFVYSNQYAPSKLSAARKAHTATLTELIARLKSLPSDLAEAAMRRRKARSSVPVLTRTAKVASGLRQRKAASPQPPAPPATAKPYFLDKPIASVASGVGQVAAEFGRITFAKIEDPSEQTGEQSDLSELSEQLDILGQEIDGLFEKEFGSALNSISGSPAIEKPVNRRSGAALRQLPAPGNKVDRNATTAIMTTMTTITANAPATVPVALGSVAPNTRGWTRKRPTGINGLPHADAEMLKNAAVLKKNRVVPGNKVQASSRPPGSNPSQRSLPPTPGQLAARKKEEDSFSSQ